MPIDGALVERLDGCRILVRAGVGYDHIDIGACGARGIPVCNVPDYGTTEVADHAIALMLALARGLVSYHARLLADPHAGWHWSDAPLVRRLRGGTFGIVGMGRIGTYEPPGARPGWTNESSVASTSRLGGQRLVAQALDEGDQAVDVDVGEATESGRQLDSLRGGRERVGLMELRAVTEEVGHARRPRRDDHRVVELCVGERDPLQTSSLTVSSPRCVSGPARPTAPRVADDTVDVSNAFPTSGGARTSVTSGMSPPPSRT